MTSAPPVSAAPDIGLIDANNPWPGLEEFQEGQAAFFFGRDAEIGEVLRAVTSARLTVLFGKSGLGKSSLLRAGVFPRLRERGFLPVYLRGDFGAGAPSASNQIRAALLEQAREAGVEAPPWSPGTTAWEYLHVSDVEFWTARHKLLTPVFVFDQFEELFTRGGHTGAARAFVSEVEDLVEGRVPISLRDVIEANPERASPYRLGEHRYRVLLSLREDYLAELEGCRHDMPSVLSNRVRVSPMNGAQALLAVTGPGKDLVSEAVAQQVVRALSGYRGAQGRSLEDLEVEPTLLSLMCRELNNRRLFRNDAHICLEDHDAIGSDVLSGFYRRCVKDVSPELRIFLEERLITAHGFRDTEAVENAIQQGIRRDEIERLVQRRLIRVEEWSGVSRIELVHDVLTEVVKRSRDMRITVEAAATVASEQAAQVQKAREIGEKRREKIVRRLGWVVAGALAAICVLTGVLLFFAYRTVSSQAEVTDSRGSLELLREQDHRLAFRSVVGDDAEGVLRLSLLLRNDPNDDVARAALLNELLWTRWPGRGIPAALPMSLQGCTGHGNAAVVRWSTTNGIIAWHSKDGAVCSWQSGSGLESLSLPALPSKSLPDVDAEGLRAVIEPQKGQCAIASVVGGEAVTIHGHGPFRMCRLGSEGTAVTVDALHLLETWNLETGEPIGEPIDLRGAARHVASLRSHVAVLRQDGDIYLVDRSTGTIDNAIDEPCAVLVEPSRTNNRILTVCPRRARIWDAANGKLMADIMGLEDTVTQARFSRDGSRVAVGTKEGHIDIWDVESGLPIAVGLDQGAEVLSLDFSPGGQRIAAAGFDGRVQVWDIPSGSPDGTDDLRTVANAMVGRQLRESGEVEAELAPESALQAVRVRVADAPPLGPTTASILRWLLSEPGGEPGRASSPFAAVGLRLSEGPPARP